MSAISAISGSKTFNNSLVVKGQKKNKLKREKKINRMYAKLYKASKGKFTFYSYINR